MTSFERERLNRYMKDANDWLAQVNEILRYPETTQQAAAAAMIRAAIELVAGARQQMDLDK